MNQQSYDKARDSLMAKDYKAAQREFREALNSIDEHHEFYNKTASYLGLTQVLTADHNGLLLCRDAASSGVVEGDVYLNLACAEWYANNRKRAIEAVNRGREMDANHQQLVRASTLVDSRRRNIFPFLPRQHVLNQWLGRMMRKNRDPLSVHTLLC